VVDRPTVFLVLASIGLFSTGPGPCYASDIKAGRAKALMCQACHGLDGLSKVPDAPNIAGQTEPYLVAQLQEFKTGARKNDAMTVVASSLSDTDIENLAAYYSAIEINVGKIPGQ
jgi:cytochrome c553